MTKNGRCKDKLVQEQKNSKQKSNNSKRLTIIYANKRMRWGAFNKYYQIIQVD
jgi:hypothetical protein